MQSNDDLLDLINLSDLYIGPDTGPTHMASFLNKPSIVLGFNGFYGGFPCGEEPSGKYFTVFYGVSCPGQTIMKIT